MSDGQRSLPGGGLAALPGRPSGVNGEQPL